MTIFKRCVAGACILVGALFLISVGSDIQLGFGVVLVALGLLNIN